MKIKIPELTGTALDWAVAKCEGYSFTTDGINTLIEKDEKLQILGHCTAGNGIKCGYSPSTDWAQGGPIIERERIEFQDHVTEFSATYRLKAYSYGITQLIAGMRCYVASKFGNEVEIPYEIAGE